MVKLNGRSNRLEKDLSENGDTVTELSKEEN